MPYFSKIKAKDGTLYEVRGGSGSTVSVEVGDTETLAPGVSAYVMNVGTEQDVVLDFGIPQGGNGARGSQTYTTTTAPTSPNYTFTKSNLVGYTAEKGVEVGDVIFYSTYRYTVTSVADTTVCAATRVSLKGSTGTAATVNVGTVTTLEPGSQATVTNSGTTSAAVLNFGIPKGAQGDPGSGGGSEHISIFSYYNSDSEATLTASSGATQVPLTLNASTDTLPHIGADNDGYMEFAFPGWVELEIDMPVSMSSTSATAYMRLYDPDNNVWYMRKGARSSNPATFVLQANSPIHVEAGQRLGIQMFTNSASVTMSIYGQPFVNGSSYYCTCVAKYITEEV